MSGVLCPTLVLGYVGPIGSPANTFGQYCPDQQLFDRPSNQIGAFTQPVSPTFPELVGPPQPPPPSQPPSPVPPPSYLPKSDSLSFFSNLVNFTEIVLVVSLVMVLNLPKKKIVNVEQIGKLESYDFDVCYLISFWELFSKPYLSVLYQSSNVATN